jgi:hypothetical protein
MVVGQGHADRHWHWHFGRHWHWSAAEGMLFFRGQVFYPPWSSFFFFLGIIMSSGSLSSRNQVLAEKCLTEISFPFR